VVCSSKICGRGGANHNREGRAKHSRRVRANQPEPSFPLNQRGREEEK